MVQSLNEQLKHVNQNQVWSKKMWGKFHSFVTFFIVRTTEPQQFQFIPSEVWKSDQLVPNGGPQTGDLFCCSMEVMNPTVSPQLWGFLAQTRCSIYHVIKTSVSGFSAEMKPRYIRLLQKIRFFWTQTKESFSRFLAMSKESCSLMKMKINEEADFFFY